MSVERVERYRAGAIVKEVTFNWDFSFKYPIRLDKDATIYSPNFEFKGMLWLIVLYIPQIATMYEEFQRTMNRTSVWLHRVDSDKLKDVTLLYYFTLRKQNKEVHWRSSKLKEEFRVDNPKGTIQKIENTCLHFDMFEDRIRYSYCICCSFTLIKRRIRMTSIKDADILSKDFERVLKSEDKSDVTFIVKGREFPAHRLILAARSPVFWSMFQHQIEEKAPVTLIKEENVTKQKMISKATPSACRGKFVHIPDCDPDGFDDFLHYLYTGEVKKVTESSVLHIFNIANKFGEIKLAEICLKFMVGNLSVESFCDFATVGLQHCKLPLAEAFKTFFRNNVKQIVVTDKWKIFCSEKPVNANELWVSSLN